MQQNKSNTKAFNKSDTRIESLLAKAKTLPRLSGSYLMKNLQGKIIYVGKAKDLRSRVTSYFTQGAKNAKTFSLVSHIADFDFMITDNDESAFILENNLIKKFRPKYNINLKDDKTYPYLCINFAEAFPKLEFVRRVKNKEGKAIYGPFTNASDLSYALRLLTKTLGLRDCSNFDFKTRKTPCLIYQMSQCMAPCVGQVSEETYKEKLLQAKSFFEGKGREVLRGIESKMQSLAKKEKFEEAIFLRDSLEFLEGLLRGFEKSTVELKSSNKNVDIVAFCAGEREIDIVIYIMRNSLLLGSKNFHFLLEDFKEDLEEEILKILFQYYSQEEAPLPQTIVLRTEKNAQFACLFEKKIEVRTPGRAFNALYKMAYEKAKSEQVMRMEHGESVFQGLCQLQELLNLKERPKTLECYDIAIWQGHSPTASQVTFYEGKPDKKNYRYYHLETREEKNNDYEMMKEVFVRRLKKGDLPDGFVVDGGKGQLNVIEALLSDLNISIPIVALAKARSKQGSEERLYLPGRLNPYVLKKSLSLFRLLTQMRDEAHRFSRKLHHKAERERVLGKKKKVYKKEK